MTDEELNERIKQNNSLEAARRKNPELFKALLDELLKRMRAEADDGHYSS